MSRVYYNEIDPFAAEWLRQLMVKGMIPKGEVDERSIEDIQPRDLDGFDQCHFFAGIGVWAYALARAGWGDRPVWTGSCPCQPFSAAGKGLGFADERHLWPAFRWLIKQQGPDIVLGEQVAAKAGAAWFDLVASDLESLGYETAAVSFPACSVGAPHLRQRLYWCGVSNQVMNQQPLNNDGRFKSLPEVPRQKATRSILQGEEIWRWEEIRLQRVWEAATQAVAQSEPRGDQQKAKDSAKEGRQRGRSLCEKPEDRKPSICANASRETKGNEEGVGVLSGYIGTDSSSGSNEVRDDGDRCETWSQRKERLRQSQPGSNRPNQGIYYGKYPSDLLGPKCGIRDMGRREGKRAIQNDLTDESPEINTKRNQGAGEPNDQHSIQDEMVGNEDPERKADTEDGGVGAPHLRQRQYWCAIKGLGISNSEGWESWREGGETSRYRHPTESGGSSGWLADGEIIRRGQINQNQRGRDEGAGEEERPAGSPLRSCNRGMAYSQRERLEGHSRDGDRSDESRRIKAHEAGSVAKGCGNRRMANAIDCSRQPEKSRATEWIVSEGDGAMQAELRPTGPTNGFWGAADWLLCRDGKWRPVEPAFEQMADGVAFAVVHLRDSCREKIERLKNETATDPGSIEIMRALRRGDAPEAVWLSLGRQIGFSKATILFSALLEQQGELGNIFDCPASCFGEIRQRVVRELRSIRSAPCPSSGRKYPQQFGEKLDDALRELSQESSLRLLATLNGFPLSEKAPARVGRLRGYGNAIVAPQAIEFSETVIELLHGRH